MVEKRCGYWVVSESKCYKVFICCKPSGYIICLSYGKSALWKHRDFLRQGRVMTWSHVKGRKFCRKVVLFRWEFFFFLPRTLLWKKQLWEGSKSTDLNSVNSSIKKKKKSSFFLGLFTLGTSVSPLSSFDSLESRCNEGFCRLRFQCVHTNHIL